MATRKKKTEKPKEESTEDAKPARTKGGKPDTKIEHFSQNLRCALADSEIVERSKRVSRLLSDKALKQEEIKSATAHLKASVKQIDAEISKLSQEVNDSAAYRDVQCERRYVYRTGKVTEVRMDTCEQIYERPMTGSERQLDLPKPGKGQAKASLEKALGHAVVEEDGPSNEDEKQEQGDDAPDQPGTDEAPESGEQGDEDEESAAE
jgi:hypothetical protein